MRLKAKLSGGFQLYAELKESHKFILFEMFPNRIYLRNLRGATGDAFRRLMYYSTDSLCFVRIVVTSPRRRYTAKQKKENRNLGTRSGASRMQIAEDR